MQARYPMQAWELTIALGDAGALAALGPREVEERFHLEHERVFGVREVGKHIEIVSWGARARAQLVASSEEGRFVSAPSEGEATSRPGYFGDTGWRDTPVLDTNDLIGRGSVPGPVIIREDITTIVIHPGQLLEVLPSGDYRLSNTAA